jgi:hypothetical protein
MCTSLYYIVIVESVAFVSYCGVLFPFSLFSRILCSASTLRRPLQCCVHSFGSIQFTYIYFGGGEGSSFFFFSHCCVFPESTKEPQQEKRARTPLPLRLYSSSARSGRSSSSLSSISIIHQQFVFFKFLKRGWVSCRNFVWLVGNPSIPWHRQLWFTISLGIRWTKSLNIIIITRIFVLFKCRVKCSHFLCFFRYSDSILTCSDDDETSNSMEFSKVRKNKRSTFYAISKWFKQNRCDMWETKDLFKKKIQSKV